MYLGKYLMGLTGNIACGKSTVGRQLRELGAYTIDADAAIHVILKRGGAAYAPVVAEFGQVLVGEDGEIDRRALGRVVFADPAKLRRLEEIEHPIVREAIEAQIQAAPEHIVVVDAIKLFESGWAGKCDTVWAITCRRDQQIARLMQTRGYPRDEAEQRVAAQSPQEDKAARANTVIDNSGTLEETRRQIATAWQAILAAQ